MYRTHVLCTQGCRNILLIGRTEVGSLSVFEWADTRPQRCHTQQSANMISDKSMLFKVEDIIVFIIY
jgi:hypothetical protein